MPPRSGIGIANQPRMMPLGGIPGAPSQCLDRLVFRLEIFQRPRDALATRQLNSRVGEWSILHRRQAGSDFTIFFGRSPMPHAGPWPIARAGVASYLLRRSE